MNGNGVTVIGGGLAGCEAAYRLAKQGIRVFLYEMRPGKSTPAHSTGELAELVCSNSLGGDLQSTPAGILKQELRMLQSLIMKCADGAKIPAGKALAVDRSVFSRLVTESLESCGNVTIIREEARRIPDGAVIIAAGPLMSGDMADELRETVGNYLSFFDAAAPIVTYESIDMARAYRADRYGSGSGDYINCPMDKEQYEAFRRELVSAERAEIHDFERTTKYFEGCLPIEVMAERGIDTLRFGPMRPVGLPNPMTDKTPYAVVQLRRDNAEDTLYNLVGFQTNLRWPEQDRVFRMIPALERAEFVRRGVMHRNSFVCAPIALDEYLRPARSGVTAREDLFLAGQITGVEGYVESAAMGLVAAIFAEARITGGKAPRFPETTAIGSLLRYLREAEPATFQPMNVNLGIFPKIETGKSSTGRKKRMSKPERTAMYAERSRDDMEEFLRANISL